MTKKKDNGKICAVCGSSNYTYRHQKGDGQFLCRRHREQMQRYGSIKDDLPSIYLNEIITNKDFAEIVLKNNQYEIVGIAKISIEDIEKAREYKWHLKNTGYVYSSKRIALHRHIVDAEDGLVVDHINRDKLDCRRENLRICTQADNNKNSGIRKDNTTGIKGITYDKKSPRPFVVRIMVNKQSLFIGRFYSREEAKTARWEAEIKYYKEFAPLLGETDD